MSETSDDGLWLTVTIPLYLTILVGTAVWAHQRETQLNGSNVDPLSVHFLGGRSFGAFMTGASMFSTFFSGYTVVGVPTEGFRNGFQSIRWVPNASMAIAVYASTGIRLRKASLMRGHTSPTDFITDRYRSQILRYTILTLQIVPTMIYLAVQVGALQGIFNDILGIHPDNPGPVIGLFVLMLFIEWAGGFASVAITDSVQAVVVAITFGLVITVFKTKFGGWSDIDLDTYPRKDFFQTPTKESQWSFWQFTLTNCGFFTLPQLMQRTYAARDLNSLRFGWTCLGVGPWIAMLGGTFVGTMTVSILSHMQRVSSPVSSMLDILLDMGGWPKITAIFIWVATTSAIMSTTDSLLIALSHLFSAEIVYPLCQNYKPANVVTIGRLCSLVIVIAALVFGLTWDEGISDMSRIQFPLSTMAAPSFFFGLYTTNKKYDLHPWSLAFGGIAGGFTVFAYYYGYLRANPDALPIDANFVGIIINLGFTLLTESVFRLYKRFYSIKKDSESVPTPPPPPPPRRRLQDTAVASSHPSILTAETHSRPLWDMPLIKRFGDHALTPEILWKSMEGVHEPIANLYYPVFMLFVVTMVTPIVPELQPALDEFGDFEEYPILIGGLPWWVVKSLAISGFFSLVFFYNIYMTPSSFVNSAYDKDGKEVDSDTMELNIDELLYRKEYDEPNVLLYQRRKQLKHRQQQRSREVTVGGDSSTDDSL